MTQGETAYGQAELRCRDGSSIRAEYQARAASIGGGSGSGSVAVFRKLREQDPAGDEIRLIARIPAENPNPVMRLTPAGAAAVHP